MYARSRPRMCCLYVHVHVCAFARALVCTHVGMQKMCVYVLVRMLVRVRVRRFADT